MLKRSLWSGKWKMRKEYDKEKKEGERWKQMGHVRACAM